MAQALARAGEPEDFGPDHGIDHATTNTGVSNRPAGPKAIVSRLDKALRRSP